MRSHRLKRIVLSDYFLHTAFRYGSDGRVIEVAGNPLPYDAQLVAANFDGRAVSFTYRSVTFDEVPEGHPIPTLDVSFRSRIP